MSSGKGAEIGIELEGRAGEKLRIPAWFGEAVLYGKYWLESGLVGRLEEAVRVVRGRMGQYEVIDYVLLLNSYAVSGEKSLADFYAALAPVQEVLMSLWGRQRCPTRSSLSRFLGAVGTSGVESLRAMFQWDLERNGVRVMDGIGLFDRSEAHSVVFDVDGTVCAVRQRALADDREHYPAGVRRSCASCAPGYRGRKRGEVIRNRTTVAQAQTSEWLGTYGGAGNGNAKRELERSCGVIKQYLESQGLNVAHGLVRLDGLYGTASLVSVVQGYGLGYIVRCRDYHLLQNTTLQERLNRAAAWDWQAVGGNSFSEVLDGGYIEEGGRGYGTPMRVIVLRTPVKLHEGRIGKQVKDYVYELFLTSYSVVSLSVIDVLSVYRGRGGFEQRLSEEDQEQDYDRWCSWHPEGQEFWQILAQWSWNWRVWLGWQQDGATKIRQTIWAEGAAAEPTNSLSPPLREPELTASLQFLRKAVDKPPVEASPTPGQALDASPTPNEAGESKPEPTYGPMMVSTEWGRGAKQGNRFGNDDFEIVDEDTVVCPAGHVMNCRRTEVKANGDLAMQFGMKARTCQRCPVKKRCLAPKTKGIAGRRVTVIRKAAILVKEPVATKSALVRSVRDWLIFKRPQAEQPIFWCDIAATRLRREWRRQLAAQEVEVKEIREDKHGSGEMRSPLLTRHQREHHRLSWWERISRNARKVGEKTWSVVLYGNANQLLRALQILIKPKSAILQSN